MAGRYAPVPFTLSAEADGFRSNVAPPPRERPGFGRSAGRWLLGLTIVAGLVGSLLLGMPALSVDRSSTSPQQSQASQGH
ncbi:hypothetical protein JS756_28085 [Streptomyces actuosus]|uniref:Uncharacterized protein n=1 Tax=Streptomyces actuosus TaxID=1885 RepID=A0ABS2VXY5_STRAS|nr:hypothetical protein [Streptomyces actuosus]MBN0047903.1 hypothetical protein [Streptomyces actuosus]